VVFGMGRKQGTSPSEGANHIMLPTRKSHYYKRNVYISLVNEDPYRQRELIPPPPQNTKLSSNNADAFISTDTPSHMCAGRTIW